MKRQCLIPHSSSFTVLDANASARTQTRVSGQTHPNSRYFPCIANAGHPMSTHRVDIRANLNNLLNCRLNIMSVRNREVVQGGCSVSRRHSRVTTLSFDWKLKTSSFFWNILFITKCSWDETVNWYVTSHHKLGTSACSFLTITCPSCTKCSATWQNAPHLDANSSASRCIEASWCFTIYSNVKKNEFFLSTRNSLYKFRSSCD